MFDWLNAHFTGWWDFGLFAVVLIVGTGRFLRLITYDDFPLTAWVRQKWADLVGPRWAELGVCPFCLAPYAAAANMAWAYFSDLHWTWWVVNAWGAVSYLSAIVVAYDQKD